MSEDFFIVTAYGISAALIALLVIATWLRARRVRALTREPGES